MARITARQRVLAYLRRWGPITVAGIARGLSMSAATVRHHLTILAEDGRITSERATGTHGRGRPRKLYRLSESMRGDNLAAVSDAVLEKWLESLPQTDRQAELKALAEELADRMGIINAPLPETKRLVQVVEQLNASHYEARWEAGAEGPRVLFAHCPYGAIIDRHPELCAMDSFLLSAALKGEAEQRSKINRQSGQPDRCVFVLRRPVKRGG